MGIMKLLVINTGSTSIKLATYRRTDQGLEVESTSRHQPDGKEAAEILRSHLGDERVDAVVHRVVHGGDRLVAPTRLDPGAMAEIRALETVAPLHNPLARRWIEAAQAFFDESVSQVGVFDTAFYADLPEVAKRYALPRDLSDDRRIRRYGFHGIAHEAMWRRWRALRPDLAEGGRLISLQLGGGCSITATRNGRPLDTSMGFSPVEGLVMASRSGDLDPSILPYLMRLEGWTDAQLDDLLNRRSGLLGLSGKSDDMAALLDDDSEPSRQAVALYCYRASKYIGAYLTVLGGTDGIVFGGGVGENAAAVRRRILEPLGWCGLRLDDEANDAAGGEAVCITSPDSTIPAWVVPVDESKLLAQAAVELLG